MPPDHLDDVGVGSYVPRLLELLKLVHMVEGGNGFVTKKVINSYVKLKEILLPKNINNPPAPPPAKWECCRNTKYQYTSNSQHSYPLQR